MYNFWRKQKWSPVQPKRDTPEMARAWLFTLRSVPHHFAEIKAAIESTGDARVWFGEPLAYLEGRGVALFRVEATGFNFLSNLYDFWAVAERDEATGFDIRLYTQNKQLAGTLRGLTLQQAEEFIKEHARLNQTASTAVS